MAETQRLNNAKRTVNSPKSFFKSYISRDTKKASEYLEQVKKVLAEYADLASDQGKAWLKEETEWADKASEELRAAEEKAAVKAITSLLHTRQRWLENAIFYKKTADIAKYTQELEKLVSERQAELESYASGKEYFETFKAWWEKTTGKQLSSSGAGAGAAPAPATGPTPAATAAAAPAIDTAHQAAPATTGPSPAPTAGAGADPMAPAPTGPSYQSDVKANATQTAAIKKMQGSLQTQKSVFNSYVSRNAISNLEKIVTDSRTLINNATDDIKDCAEGADALNKALADLGVWKAQVVTLKQREAFNKVKSAVDTDKRWLENSIKSKRMADVGKYRDRLQATLDENRSMLESSEQGKDLVALVSKALEDAAVAAAELEAAEAADKLRRELDSSKRSLEQGIKYKRVADISKHREALLATLKKHEEAIARYPACKQHEQDILKYLQENEEAAGGAVASVEAEAALRNAKSDVRFIDSYMKQGHTDKAYECFKRAQQHMAPLRTEPRFLALDEVKSYIPEFEKVEKEIDERIRSFKEEAEISQQGREIKSANYWLNDALNKKQPEEAMKKAEAIGKLFRAFKEKFASAPSAQEVINDTAALLERVEKEVKPMVEDQTVERIAKEGRVEMRWVETYLSQKNVDKVSEHRNVVVDKAETLRAMFPGHAGATAFLSDVEALLKRLDDELGDIIAQKDIDRLKSPLESNLRYLDLALSSKDVTRVSIYSKKVEEAVEPMRRYAANKDKWPAAAQLVERADAVLGRLEAEMGAIIAGKEVQEWGGKLTSALNYFEKAIDAKDIDGIISKRERVVEVGVPLRAKHSAHPEAKAVLARQQALLDRCDKEIGGIIADRDIAAIEKKVQAALNWAKGAAERKDGRGGLVHLQNAHKQAQPLLSRFPGNKRAMDLVALADAAMTELGPVCGSLVDGGEAKKQLAILTPELGKATAAYGNGQVNQAITALRSANKAATQLRARFAFLPDVRASLAELDKLNMALLGKIPEEEEGAPVLTIDWKLPVAEQDALKKCNAALANFNTAFHGALELYSKVGLDGTKGEFSRYDRDNIEKHFDVCVRQLEELKSKHLPALLVVRPDTAEAPNEAARLLQDADEPLRKLISTKRAYILPRIEYANRMAKAVEAYKQARHHEKDAQTTRLDNAPWTWERAWDEVKKAYPHLESARAQLPEDCDEADDLKKEAEALQIEIETKFRETCVANAEKIFQGIEKDLENSYDNSEQYVKALREKFPNSEEYKAVKKRKDEVSAKVKEAREARAKAIEEAERKAEEEAKAARELWDGKWKAPFTGGSIQIGNEKWEYWANGKLSNGAQEWIWHSEPNNMSLSATSSDLGEGYWTGKNFAITSYLYGGGWGKQTFRKTWQNYVFDEKDQTFGSEVGQYHKLHWDGKMLALAEGGKGDLHDSKALVTGSVPFPVVLFCIAVGPHLAEMPAWIRCRRNYNELAGEERQRREKNRSEVSKTCKACNTGGNTRSTCYNCGYWTCQARCKGQKSFSRCPNCNANGDHFSTDPQRDWKEKTVKKLSAHWNSELTLSEVQ